MNTPLTPAEAVDTLCAYIDARTAKGLCWRCAVLLASEKFGVNYERAEDTWLERQRQRAAQIMVADPPTDG